MKKVIRVLYQKGLLSANFKTVGFARENDENWNPVNDEGILGYVEEMKSKGFQFNKRLLDEDKNFKVFEFIFEKPETFEKTRREEIQEKPKIKIGKTDKNAKKRKDLLKKIQALKLIPYPNFKNFILSSFNYIEELAKLKTEEESDLEIIPEISEEEPEIEEEPEKEKPKKKKKEKEEKKEEEDLEFKLTDIQNMIVEAMKKRGKSCRFSEIQKETISSRYPKGMPNYTLDSNLKKLEKMNVIKKGKDFYKLVKG